MHNVHTLNIFFSYTRNSQLLRDTEPIIVSAIYQQIKRIKTTTFVYDPVDSGQNCCQMKGNVHSPIITTNLSTNLSILKDVI
jgi:urate oxidase